MKKTPFLFPAALYLLVFPLLCFSGPVVRAEDPLLKIQAFPDQDSVKSGMMFLVQVKAVDSSSDTSVNFWSNTCSYEKHWVTDNSAVLIQPWTCNENTLEEITLGPGEGYAKNIILYIPQKDKTGPVVFRLGFKRMSENGDVAEPLWSDPVTMNVTVPEEVTEFAPPATGPVASPPSDPVPAVPGEGHEVSPAAASASAASPGSRALVFRDPGIPVRIRPGEPFSIVLVSNPTTGFGWKLTLPEDQQIVTLLESGYIAPRKMMPGAPGEEVYKFKATAPGETKADFVYERPWEPKTAPTRKIFTILVEEN